MENIDRNEKIKEAFRIIDNARQYLHIASPFIGTLLFKTTDIIVDKEYEKVVNAASIDMFGNIYYNLEFITKLIKEQGRQGLQGLIMHEIMHLAFLHHNRSKFHINNEYDREIWNMAGDIIINTAIRHEIVYIEKNSKAYPPALPFGGVETKTINNRDIFTIKKKEIDITDLSLEQLYNILKNECITRKYNINHPHLHNQEGGSPIDCQSISGTDQFGNKIETQQQKMSGNFDKLDNNSKNIDQEYKEKWSEEIQKANEYCKMQGYGSGNIYSLLEANLKKKINWKKIFLHQVLSEIKNNFTWKKPSRRGISINTYLPSEYGVEFNICVFIDVSGSMSKKNLSNITGVLYNLFNIYPSTNMLLYTVDTEIHDKKIINKNNKKELLSLKINGGGGTDFRSAYKDLEMYKIKFKPKMSFFFTDGYATFPDKELKNIKTTWVYTDNSNKNKPPFGNLLYM